MNQISSILRRATRKNGEKLNVLCAPTHERYQSNMARVHANFYMWHGTPGVKENGWLSIYASMPRNHTMLHKNSDPIQTLPPDVDFDVILSQSPEQCQTAMQVSKILNLPHIDLRHTMFMPFWPETQKEAIKQIHGDINVFISPQSRTAWGWKEDKAEVLLHGVDTNLFRPLPNVEKKPQVLSIVNDWINRGDILGFDIWQRVVYPNFKWLVLGDTKGLSQPPANVMELVSKYNESAVFFNTSRYSPIPSVMLEAMACGLPVVTTDNCLISSVVIDNYSGFKTNDEEMMREKIQWLLDNPAKAMEMGQNARKTILEKFPLDSFISNWNSLLARAASIQPKF